MKIRTLLLGTATAFVVGGAAQAADLAVAVEPVDYVKVCDSFGVGFYYIPGTDTCLRIRGDVHLDVEISDKDFVDTNGDAVNDQNWSMSTEGNVDFTGNTMSDVGLVQTYIKLRGNANMAGPTTMIIKRAVGQIGPASFGYMGSIFDTGGGNNIGGDDYKSKDTDTNAFVLSETMGTWGVFVGVEDPYYLSPTTAQGGYPDFVAKISGGSGGVTFGVSAKVSDQTSGTGWAASANLGFDLGGGNKINIGGGYASDLGHAIGGAAGAGDTWTLLATGVLALSGNLKLAATASYIDDGVVGSTGWEGYIGPIWTLTSTSSFEIDALYKDTPTESARWGAVARLKTWFAGGT